MGNDAEIVMQLDGESTDITGEAESVFAKSLSAREAKIESSSSARSQPSRPGVKIRDMVDDLQEVLEQHRPAKGTIDRGAGFYKEERLKLKLASLVETGRHAGRSRVKFMGVSARRLLYHLWKRDFFITAINTSFWPLLGIISAVYIVSFFIFGCFWWAVIKGYGNGMCLTEADGFGDAIIFSTATQATIGYGNVAIDNCWVGAWLMVLQSLWGMILDSIIIGLVFARISHPKQRGRTILISDSACISRRDGILKFMFRIADIRVTQVIEPKVVAFLYTWGDGRVTSEGEYIPYRCEPLNIGYIDGMLLLPLTIEHTIDERSPLYGHTHDTLMDLQAEIVVTFEGTTEYGNPFMARQSYLAPEIHWGYKFAKIIPTPSPNDTQYTVDLSQFHDIEPEVGLPMSQPSALSKLVVSRVIPTVPYPLLGENTLAVSDKACVCTVDGKTTLMWRVGDTYPNQMVEVHVRAYIYRWDTDSRLHGKPKYRSYELEMGYTTFGQDRLALRLPVLVSHVIDNESPLLNWTQQGGALSDADSDLVLVVEGYLYSTSKNIVRMRTYNVFNSVKFGHKFSNIVTPPQLTRDFKPRVDWSRFHEVEPVEEVETRTHQSVDPTSSINNFLKRAQSRDYDDDALGFGVEPPESVPSLLHSNENTVTSANRSQAMGIPTGASSGVASSSRYMGEVMDLDADLQRYNPRTGQGVASVTTPYDNTLAVMTKSPEQHVHYSNLNSLFAAAEALAQQQEEDDRLSASRSANNYRDSEPDTASPELDHLLGSSRPATQAPPPVSGPQSNSRAYLPAASFAPRHSVIAEAEEEGLGQHDSSISLPAIVRSSTSLLRRTRSG